LNLERASCPGRKQSKMENISEEKEIFGGEKQSGGGPESKRVKCDPQSPPPLAFLGKAKLFSSRAAKGITTKKKKKKDSSSAKKAIVAPTWERTTLRGKASS